MSDDHDQHAHGPDADDDGKLGSHSIPAMLKSVRALISGHQVVAASSRAPCTADSLSTVMGTFTPMRVNSKARDKLLADTPQLSLTISDLIASPDEEEQKEGSDCLKDVHHLIKMAVEAQNQSWRQLLPAVLESYLEDEVVDKIQKSSERELKKASCFAVQCLTLHTGVKAGQPWKREQAVTQFQKDLEFMVEKYDAISINRDQLKESRTIAADLRSTNSVQEQIDNETLAGKLKKLDPYISTFVQNMTP